MSFNRQTVLRIFHGDALVAAGLKFIFSSDEDLLVIDEHGLPESSEQESRGGVGEVIVADYEHALAKIAAMASCTAASLVIRPRILVISSRDSEADIQRAVHLGIQGYVVQGCSGEEALYAVKCVARGTSYLCSTATKRMASSMLQPELTRREMETLSLVCAGYCNKSISRELGVCVGTVKSHMRSIFRKLDATCRTQAVLLATRRGLVSPGSEARAYPEAQLRGDRGLKLASPALTVAGRALRSALCSRERCDSASSEALSNVSLQQGVAP